MESAASLVENGRLLLGQGSTAPAGEHFQKALKVDPLCAEAHFGLYQVHGQLNNNEQALMHLAEALRARPTLFTPEQYFPLASVFVSVGRLRDALLCYTNILRAAPEDRKARIEGSLIKMQLGDLESAFSDLTALRREFPQLRDEDLNGLGTISEICRRIRITQKRLVRALGFDPQLPVSDAERLRAQEAAEKACAGDIAGAFAIYNSFLRGETPSAPVYLNLGLLAWHLGMLVRRADMIEQGLGYMRQAVKSNPTWYLPFYHFGHIVEQSPEREKELGRAHQNFLKATQLNPAFGPAQLALAQSAFKNGYEGDVESAYASYLELVGNDADGLCRVIGETMTKTTGTVLYVPDAALKAERLGWMPQGRWAWELFDAEDEEDTFARRLWLRTDARIGTQLERSRVGHFVSVEASLVKLPSGKVVDLLAARGLIDAEWEKLGHPPLISFSEEERDAAWEKLARLNITPRNKFALFYLVGAGGGGASLPHHVPLSTYRQAIECLVKRGVHVVIATASETGGLEKISGVINYGGSALRSYELDVFLCSQALLTVTGGGFFREIAEAMQRPVIATNEPPPLMRSGRRTIVLPKLLWRSADGAYLPLSTLCEDSSAKLAAPAVSSDQPPEYHLIENSPQDITDAVNEMCDRLSGAYCYSLDEIKRQDIFRAQLDKSEPFMPSISKEFLRKYPALLEIV